MTEVSAGEEEEEAAELQADLRAMMEGGGGGGASEAEENNNATTLRRCRAAGAAGVVDTEWARRVRTRGTRAWNGGGRVRVLTLHLKQQIRRGGGWYRPGTWTGW